MILQNLDWAVHNPHSATETCSTKILFDCATLSAFHNFCLMHFSVDMKWQKFCFFSIIYPWFLFFGSHLRLPGLQMWSGEDVIDQYLILSCMVSKPVTTSIRVAVGNHGYMCVWYADYQIMHNLQFDLVIHDISILYWFCKFRLIRPVCLCPCILRRCIGYLLPLLCMSLNFFASIWYLW